MLRLLVIWLWFAAVLGSPACLNQPILSLVGEIPGPAVGMYYHGAGVVSVEESAPSWVAVHELAHHAWYVCRIAGRPAGRHFLTDTGRVVSPLAWDTPAREQWAATLTWVLTGHREPDTRRQAAHTLRNLIPDPTPAQAARLRCP